MGAGEGTANDAVVLTTQGASTEDAIVVPAVAAVPAAARSACWAIEAAWHARFGDGVPVPVDVRSDRDLELQLRSREAMKCGPLPSGKKRQRCEHFRWPSRCVDCKGGDAPCAHKWKRRQCEQCGNGYRCRHEKLRTMCKECGGGSLCACGKAQRGRCKECRGPPDAVAAAQEAAAKEEKARRDAEAQASREKLVYDDRRPLRLSELRATGRDDALNQKVLRLYCEAMGVSKDGGPAV